MSPCIRQQRSQGSSNNKDPSCSNFIFPSMENKFEDQRAINLYTPVVAFPFPIVYPLKYIQGQETWLMKNIVR